MLAGMFVGHVGRPEVCDSGGNCLLARLLAWHGGATVRIFILVLTTQALLAATHPAQAGKRYKGSFTQQQAGQRPAAQPANHPNRTRLPAPPQPSTDQHFGHRHHTGYQADCYHPQHRRLYQPYSGYYVDRRYSSFGYGYMGYIYQPVVVPSQFQIQYAPSYPSGYGVGGQSIPTSIVPQYQLFSPNTGQANPAFHNEAIREALKENDLHWLQPLQAEPLQGKPAKEIPASTAEAKLASMHDQANGDMWFRKQKYQLADQRYRAAINHARDLAEPYFRLALAKAHTGLYDSAVRSLRQGLQLDPTWPTTGKTFDSLYTDETVIARTVLLQRVADWVRQDIRDPDRLFLLGVLMHFDSDKRSQEVFELAYRLAGQGDHLSLFLNPVTDPITDTGKSKPTGKSQSPAVEKPAQNLIPPLPAPPLPKPHQNSLQQSQPGGPVLQPGDQT